MTCEKCQNQTCAFDTLEEIERIYKDASARGIMKIPDKKKVFEKAFQECRAVGKSIDRTYVENVVKFLAANPHEDDNDVFLNDAKRLFEAANKTQKRTVRTLIGLREADLMFEKDGTFTIKFVDSESPQITHEDALRTLAKNPLQHRW